MSSLRWWGLLAGVALVAILALLVLRGRARPGGGTASSSAAGQVDAGAGCPDRTALPAPPLEGAETAGLVLRGDHVTFTVDGSAAFGDLIKPQRLSAGVHRVQAKDDLGQAELEVRLRPFEAAAVTAVRHGGGLVLWPLGAECVPCAKSVSNLDTTPSGADKPGALASAAAALATQDWKLAVELLRDVPAKERSGPRFVAVFAAATALAGHAELAREALRQQKGPAREGAVEFLDGLDKLADDEAARQRELAVKRWNNLTERFQRLTERFSAEAPVAQASGRFNALSEAFSAATKEEDIVGQEASVESAGRVLRSLVGDLRAMQPNDCAWQAKISAAM